MIPPGLAFVALSGKAWKLTENSDLPKYYWDFKKAKKAQDKNQTVYTPAITLVCALRESLRLLKKEGWDNVLGRHAKLAKATRQGVLALGLQIFSKAPSNVLTAVEIPSSVGVKRLRGLMRDRYGVEVAGGQAALAEKIIRIAHLGAMEVTDIIVVLSALEMSLSELGYPVEMGKGIAAAEEILGR
jgi:aspartate aminotransferase-like enzyme